MNEMKRQLNQKMGDTSERASRVIQKIEAVKKVKRTSKKLKSSGPIYIAIASFVTVLALFFLLGPWSDRPEQSTPDPEPIPTDNGEANGGDESISAQKELLRSFFKQDGDVAYFIGVGNEYATFKETTKWINPDYVEIVTDNGGSITQTIYRITPYAIEVIVEQNAEDGVITPSVDELIFLQSAMTVLSIPLENGKTFDDNKKTMQLNVPLKTTYGDFITTVVEYKGDGATISKYYAKDFGLVGDVYTFEDGTKIESYLASINEQPTVDDSLTIEIYNETTKLTEPYFIKNLPFIDPYVFEVNPDYYSMTYRMLESVGNTEVGVLTYACDEREHCTNVFVSKSGDKIDAIAHTWGSYGNVGISPNKEFLIVPINSTEQDGNSFVERNQLLLINLYTFKQFVPDVGHEYFESPTYPIVSYEWVNDTLTITVGDIKSYSHADVAAWQKLSPRPTKAIAVKITSQ
jgi:hypothetical protein